MASIKHPTIPTLYASEVRDFARTQLGLKDPILIPATQAQKARATGVGHFLPSHTTDAVVVTDGKRTTAHLVGVRVNSSHLQAEDASITLASLGLGLALGPFGPALTLPLALAHAIKHGIKVKLSKDASGHADPRDQAALQVALKHAAMGLLSVGTLGAAQAAVATKALETLHHTIEGAHQAFEVAHKGVESTDALSNIASQKSVSPLRIARALRDGLISAFKVHEDHHPVAPGDIRFVHVGVVPVPPARTTHANKRPLAKVPAPSLDTQLAALLNSAESGHHADARAYTRVCQRRLTPGEAAKVVATLRHAGRQEHHRADAIRALEALSRHPEATVRAQAADARMALRHLQHSSRTAPEAAS